MTYAKFQEHFERGGALERQHFDAMPIAAVISEIRAGRLGRYYQVWYSLGARAKPSEANSLLLSFLASEAAYLHRYHCAAALIQVNRLNNWAPRDLSASKKYPIAENLAKLRAQLYGV